MCSVVFVSARVWYYEKCFVIGYVFFIVLFVCGLFVSYSLSACLCGFVCSGGFSFFPCLYFSFVRGSVMLLLVLCFLIYVVSCMVVCLWLLVSVLYVGSVFFFFFFVCFFLSVFLLGMGFSFFLFHCCDFFLCPCVVLFFFSLFCCPLCVLCMGVSFIFLCNGAPYCCVWKL